MPCLVLLAAAFAAGSPAPAASTGRGLPVLDPRSDVSPSGRVVLHVDPTDRRGAGPASYRLVRDGVDVWRGERRFTLWEARVREDGTCVGYAYTEGILGRGDLLVAALDPSGGERILGAYSRAHSGVPCGSFLPKVDGILLDEVGQVLVLRVIARDDRIREQWWRWHLPSGNELPPLRSDQLLPEGAKWTAAAEPVRGTGLVVGQFGRRRRSFALLDLDAGCAVWEERFALEDAELVASAEPGRFAVRTAADGALRRFEVVRNGTAVDVRELDEVAAPPGREPEPEPEPLELEELPPVHLRGRVAPFGVRGRPAPVPGRIHSVSAVALDRWRELLLVADRVSQVVHVFDLDGTLVGGLVVPPGLSDRMRFFMEWVDVDRDGVVTVMADWLQHLAFDPAGTVEVRDEDWREEGRVHLPSGNGSWVSHWDHALRVSQDGRVLARAERIGDGRWLRDVCALAVAADGSLAVLDAELGDAHVFGPDGEPRLSLEAPDEAAEVAWDGRWIAVATRGHDVLVARPEEGELRRLANAPPDRSEPWWRRGVPMLVRGELWVLRTGTLVVHRYRLP